MEVLPRTRDCTITLQTHSSHSSGYSPSLFTNEQRSQVDFKSHHISVYDLKVINYYFYRFLKFKQIPSIRIPQIIKH